MKLIKLSFIIAVAVMAIVGISTTSYAFHSGGVAECDGCHTMHNSLDDAAMSTKGGLTQFHAGPYLLQGSTQSEACLNCHEDPAPGSYHISTPANIMTSGLTPAGSGIAPIQMSPGGDFGWLRTDYTFAVRGTPSTNWGNHRGHSINAPGFGYQPLASGTSPGGTYPAPLLACSSCHNPHSDYRINAGGMAQRALGTNVLPIYTSGSYGATPTAWGAVGVYRFLGGTGYLPKSVATSGAAAFNAMPPVAVAPSSYNRTEATSQTRVAYGMGMGEWCANCHGSMLENGYTTGMSGLVHPAGNAALLTLDGAGIAVNYNAYVKSGDLTGATSSAYLSLVPYEEGTSSLSTLKSHSGILNGNLSGPTTGTENVMCLSCHRAHASGFQSMLRYSHENEFMTIADASGNSIYDNSTTEGKVNRGLSSAEQQAAYYGRPATNFAPNQRLLCNKCHAKD